MGLNSLTPILIFFHSPRNFIMVKKGAGLIGLTLLSYKFNVYKRVIKYINKSTLMFEEVAQRVVKPPMYHDVGHVCLRKWDRWTGQDNRAEKREDPLLNWTVFFSYCRQTNHKSLAASQDSFLLFLRANWVVKKAKGTLKAATNDCLFLSKGTFMNDVV